MVRRQFSGSEPPSPQMDDGKAEGMSPVRPIVSEPATCAVPPAALTAISRALTRSTISMFGRTVTMPGNGLKGTSTSGNISDTHASGFAGLGPLGIHPVPTRGLSVTDVVSESAGLQFEHRSAHS